MAGGKKRNRAKLPTARSGLYGGLLHQYVAKSALRECPVSVPASACRIHRPYPLPRARACVGKRGAAWPDFTASRQPFSPPLPGR
jgi:hypothetical protein